LRLRADIWVAAFIRRCEVEGAFALLRRRGAAEAGAIFIKLDRLDGRAALFGPAPQSELAESGVERLWRRAHAEEWLEPRLIEERLAREIGFDPDIWIVEVEDREGKPRLDLAPG
jgi:hypothetical protein